ncbi:hypothetical protein SLEP1_g7070 [Rubroshorea leprosula]|uniref:Uncharacterized protein n=1 Tax=Rubroshorea leprosula TaxID=152421 RepID=A0AAV5I693_9ROSI|nr:hypothetical protein SLEP1_g7070 [Rubroshorea leprosula]
MKQSGRLLLNRLCLQMEPAIFSSLYQNEASLSKGLKPESLVFCCNNDSSTTAKSASLCPNNKASKETPCATTPTPTGKV